MKKLRDAVNLVKQQGHGEDSILAHINPREARVLRSLGGSGRINRRTGIMEFDDGGDGGGDGGGDSGGGAGAGGNGDGDGGLGGSGLGGIGGGVRGFGDDTGWGLPAGVGVDPDTGFATGPAGWDSPGYGYGAGYSSGPGTGITATASLDPGLAAALRAFGFGDQAVTISGIDDVNRAIGLGNFAEAQAVAANISPTRRQRVMGAITGMNYSPSVEGIAQAIAAGAMAQDITRGYNTGNLASNEYGEVTPDAFGQTLSALAPMAAIAKPMKLGLMGIMGITPQISTPGLPSLASAAYRGYQNFGDLAAASRALAAISRGQSPTEAAQAQAAPTSLAALGGAAPTAVAGSANPTAVNQTAAPSLASLQTGSPTVDGGLNRFAVNTSLGPWSGYAPRLFG